MSTFNYVEAFDRLLNYYYSVCEGRIMPLLLLYLAKESQPGKEKLGIDEKIREPLNWNDGPEKRYKSPVLAQFTKEYAGELAKVDPAGKHILERWECNEMDHMSIIVHITNPQVKKARACFQKYDETKGEENWKICKALLDFVKGLECIPHKVLAENYLMFANKILKAAKVIDEMEDYDLAMFERWMIKKSFKGSLLVSQAKTPFAAANCIKSKVVTESAGPDAELDSMISYLLVHGNGCKDVISTSSEIPFKNNHEEKFDLVIMNRASHKKFNQHSDWHDCLKYVKDKLSETGRFIGAVENKYLFAMLNKQELFKEILANKQLESVILLPKKYGFSLVTVNKAKRNPDVVRLVNLYEEQITYDKDNPWQNYKYEGIVQKNSRPIAIEKLQRESVKLSMFFEYKLPEMPGFELVPLRKYLKRIPQESSFSVANLKQNKRIGVIDLSKKSALYSPYKPILDFTFVDTFALYKSYYCLEDTSLVVNKKGPLEAKIYGEFEPQGKFKQIPSTRPAYITDVLAFTIKKYDIYAPYIINELRKKYVRTQLEHWMCSSQGIHSEDEIFDLKIYVPVSDNPFAAERKICELELDQSILPDGDVIENDGDKYTILKCLGKGGFGISYLVRKENYFERKELVLKEYFAEGLGGQESQRDENRRVSLTLADLYNIKEECSTIIYLEKFIHEAELMMEFRKYPGCRIRTASKLFRCQETNTFYYETDYFRNGTLSDELKEFGLLDESEAIERIMKPLARALKTMHDNGWLHLDIKAANVMIADDGLAMLGDLGISQKWENGKKVTKGAVGIGSEGASQKQKSFDAEFASEFHPEQDVYSLAALYLYMLTGCARHRRFRPELLDEYDISDQSKQAITAALLNGHTLETTPKTVLEFMRMLPGCEDLELPEIEPVEFVEKQPIIPEGESDFDDLPMSECLTEDLPTINKD